MNDINKSNCITKFYDPLDGDGEKGSNDKEESKEEVETSTAAADDDEEEEKVDGTEKEGDGEEEEEKEETKEPIEVEAEAKAETTTISTKSFAIFKGVDTSVATLTINVSDLDIPLGSSAEYDVGPLCEIDVLGGVTKKITELDVAIVPNDGAGDGTVVDEITADAPEKEGEEKDNNDAEEGAETESEYFQDAVQGCFCFF